MSSQTTLSGRTREMLDKRKQPTEQVVRCQWPINCLLEASFNAIDFGYNPPIVWKLCEHHAEMLSKAKSHVIKEMLKP